MTAYEQMRRDFNDFTEMYYEQMSIYQDIARKLGMPDSAFYILYALWYRGRVSQAQLSSESGLSRQTINSSVMRLKEQGIVTTELEGRTSFVELTEAGRRYAEERIAPVVKMEQMAMDEFGAGNMDTLLGLMDDFIKILRKGADGLESR